MVRNLNKTLLDSVHLLVGNWKRQFNSHKGVSESLQ